jgi:chitodextrinase
LQEAYIKKVIDTVNDLDNVLYEICNESDGGTATMAWQQHMVTYIKNYEATLPNQHPVGITVPWPNGSNSALFSSNADWVSPNGTDYQNNPPASTGAKVIISDTDHLWGIGGDRTWAWKSFTRGLNVIYMDPYDSSANASLRKNLGYILGYANRMDLATATPRSELASTGYCLASVGKEYLVYSPSGSFSVNLISAPGNFSVEWLNPSTGQKTTGSAVAGSSQKSFTPPFSGDSVLYLKKTGVVDATPPSTPTGVTATVISSSQINLNWNPSTDNVGVTGYNVFRNAVNIAAVSGTSYPDTSLTPDTTYFYTISAYDAAGNESSISDKVSAKTLTTPSDSTSPVISNARVYYITRSSARITWTTNEPSDSQVEYGRTKAYGSKTSLNTAMVTGHSVTINGLSSRTTYHFRVYSKDASANLSVSSDKSFTTTWTTTTRFTTTRWW